MEFKGTKGKWDVTKFNISKVWVIRENGLKSCVCELNNQHQQGFYKYINIPLNERKANAQLISKAPEMLEMIEELAENLSIQLGRLGCCGEGDGKDHRADNDSLGGNDLLIRAKELIKEATTIENGS